ncbi:unnamed protein product [Oikopleura dioica]|uniref:Uncharacterized protein n=1 Tax=Oikopleura dioica TaxID=34765 RepID=E4XRZ2_OIKDI|nr:unnamed protein product [Oikopleura dioica]
MRALPSFGLLGVASCWNDYAGYQKISIDFKSADLGKKILSYLETLPSYDEWQLDQQRVEFIISKDDHQTLLADIDTFFRDIESIKSSRFSVPEQDVPTGLYLQDYDQYLTNDQKKIPFFRKKVPNLWVFAALWRPYMAIKNYFLMFFRNQHHKTIILSCKLTPCNDF